VDSSGVVADGAVGQLLTILVNQQMDVRRTAGVVTGENTVELNDTVIVGLLDTTKEGGVEAGLRATDARVDASGVAVPHLDEVVGDGLASVDVNDLVVEGDRHTALTLGNILAYELARNIFEKKEVSTNGK